MIRVIKEQSRVLSALIILGSLLSCGKKGNSNNESLSFADKIKLRQYKVQGEQLYLQHCANCHQQDGSGLGKLIPPLAGNDHLESNKGRVICNIRNGMERPLMVNGVEYNGKMPANFELTNLQIAEIVTYIGNSWDNSMKIVVASDVEKALLKCE